MIRPFSRTARLLALLLTAASLPALAQFKCRQADGATAYQQTPCSGSQTEQRAGSPAPAPVAAPAAPADASGQAAAARVKVLAAEADRKMRIRAAIESRQPLVGMSRAELDLAMGNPDKINADQYGARSKNQLIYYRGDRTLLVYTTDGMVTAIQNRDGVPSSTRKTPCPTETEIRNIEVEMSKIANRGNERLQASLASKLEKARACR